MDAVGGSLDGAALRWYHCLPAATKADVETFKQEFKERFHALAEEMNFLAIKQQQDESTDKYVERAEKLALGHDLPEPYKVEFTANGILNKYKEKVLSREQKTFRKLRHFIACTKGEGELVF